MKPFIGNAVVGQSGGPTAAINATLAGVLRGCAKAKAIRKVYGAVNGVEGLLEGKICDVTALARRRRDLEILKTTPASALGSCRKKLPDPATDEGRAVCEKLLAFFKEKNIRYFFYIGGNDSMDTVAKFSSFLEGNDYEMRVIGVPKTVDNDLDVTDHTPGFGSAAKYIATSVEEILRDTAVYTVRAVTIVEIMGRDAGWLTAAAALPRRYTDVAPDAVYLPEVPFSLDRMYEDVERAFEKHPNVLLAVSEGVRFPDGHYVGEGSQNGVTDVFGHRYLAGTGKVLEEAIKEHFGCKVRSIELSLPQRCASHLLSKTDIEESVKTGQVAVSLAIAGESGVLPVCVRRGDGPYAISFESRPIAAIANAIKTVPDAYIDARGSNVTDEALDYLAPLVEGEVFPPYRGGIPVHYTIRKD